MDKNSNENIDFIEFNLKNGRKSFSMKELVNFKGKNFNAAKQYIKYSISINLIKNLSEGFYAIYSPSEKDSGKISPDDFINQLMSYKEINYYAGLLSASAFYGATHYRPLVYQVIVDKQIHTPKNILEGINFHRKKYFPEHCIIKQKGNYGYINYSSPALTAYDLIKYENESGTISNIILVISDILSQIKISDIKNLLKNNLEVAYIQRLGFILEKLEANELINPLFEYSKKATSYIPLSRIGNKSGNKNIKWKIIENVNWKDFIAP
ncbi:MAG: type IV toxin-antitoxin system AbiEi family antitoxin [Ignavibacteria bacterium]